MTGSMYASVAGLKAHMQKLTVIGNNVANVNTQGYKKQRTVFRDSVYSMYSAGSNGTTSVGGMNPSQLGYGSMVGSIDLNMSSSRYNPGNPMDCALVGDGFFLVGTKDVENSTNPEVYDANFSAENFKALNLTRVGDFKFGPDNYLVDSKGNVVYGFMTTAETETVTGADGKPVVRQVVSDQLVPIRLPRWDENHQIKYARTDIDPKTDAPVGGNNQGGGGGAADTTAAQRLVDDKPKYAPNNNQGGAGNNPDADAPAADEEYEFARLDSISIDSKTGCISGTSKEDGKPVIIGYLAIGSVTNPNGVTHIRNSYYKCQEGAGSLSISMLGNVQKDLWKGGPASVGYSRLEADAAAGGGGAAGGDAPEPVPGTDILGGDTEMMVGFLEAPNVDLAEEISELITTQRGYQANTRIITVTDSMLEELVNMKR